MSCATSRHRTRAVSGTARQGPSRHGAAAPSKSWPWTAQAHAQDCSAAVRVPHRGGKDTHTGVSHASRPGASAGLQDSGYDLGVTLLPDLHVNGGPGCQSRQRLHQTHTEWGQDGCRALGHHPRPAQGRAGWTRGPVAAGSHGGFRHRPRGLTLAKATLQRPGPKCTVGQPGPRPRGSAGREKVFGLHATGSPTL